MENHHFRVLVSGATGFLAMHCVKQLLNQGYMVRGTVRALNGEKTKALKKLENQSRLELVEANLEDDMGWERAAENCDFVLHIASPVAVVPDDSIVETAVNGTLNVLRGVARQKTVQKVVLTSSFSEGLKQPKKIYTEESWTNLRWKSLHPYHRSKTTAEQAAWNFVSGNSDVNYKLTVLNPSFMVGPLSNTAESASTMIISRFMDGSMPAYPELKLGCVDVRDVAMAHLIAMRQKETDGERIILNAETLSFQKIASVLRKEFGTQGYTLPRVKTPYFLLRLYAFFNEEARRALPLYGHEEYFDNSKACRLLRISFSDPKKALIEMVYDMIECNFLPKKRRYSILKKEEFLRKSISQ